MLDGEYGVQNAPLSLVLFTYTLAISVCVCVRKISLTYLAMI